MFDLIVIGGGPAGVTAALRARELGAQTLLIERGPLGGTCTNDGCVPTRVLAKAARLMRDSSQFADYGLEAPAPDGRFRASAGAHPAGRLSGAGEEAADRPSAKRSA